MMMVHFCANQQNHGWECFDKILIFTYLNIMYIVDAIMFKDSHLEMDWMLCLLTIWICGVQANRSQMYLFFLF